MWFWKIMVRFFMSLDSVLFNFISELYDLLIAISRTSILTQGDIAQFAGRIELLLGIFMLFKLSFSLITYIVNPEDFSDKSKGFGKLIQSAVVSLVMLILVPYIFQMAYSLQAKILDDNLLAKLILGENLTNSENNGGKTNNATVIDKAGDIMAFQVMLPFFKPRVSVAGLTDCVNLYKDKEFNEACKNALHDAGLTGYNLDNYVYGIENNSLGLTFRVNTALQTTGEGDNEQFIIDYMYPISTVVAVVVCLLLVTFCIDIGLRSVKLAFLQLIYPIPVIAYMDPKAGKDGIFKKWYQMCISTFLSLFIRLIALYFGVYIIAKVADFGMYDIINGSQITNGFVVIFVIIGVLMFVKQLPKILENLGIKLDGDGKFSLNPLKKIEEGAIGGKHLSRVPMAAAGAAIGLGMGAVGTATGAGKGKWLTGLASGLSNGLKGKKIGEIHKAQVDANQRMREALASGSTFFGRRGSDIRNLIGAAERQYSIDAQIAENERRMKPLEDEIEAMKIVSATKGSMKDRAKSQLYGAKFDASTAGVEYTKMQQKLLKAKNKKDAFEESMKAKLEAGKITRTKYAKAMTQMTTAFNNLEDQLLEEYADYSLHNNAVAGVDKAITGLQAKTNATIRSSDIYAAAGIKEISGFKDVKDNDGKAQGRITDIEVNEGLNEMRQTQKELKTSDAYSRAQADKKARGR